MEKYEAPVVEIVMFEEDIMTTDLMSDLIDDLGEV